MPLLRHSPASLAPFLLLSLIMYRYLSLFNLYFHPLNPMPYINALELPEVVQIIASYLSDLKPCLTVSKAWRSLYLPYYWCEVIAGIQIIGKKYKPLFDSIRHHQYREFVRVLTVHGNYCHLDSIHQSIDYPNLRMLRFYFRARKVRNGFYDEDAVLKDFVNRHPLLECLDVDNIPPFIMDSAWTALVDHPRLVKVIVKRSSSVPDDFWRVCARLRTLELSYSNHSIQWCVPKGLVLSSIRRLKLVTSNDLNIIDEYDILAACPLLEDLYWWRVSFYKGPMWGRFRQLATQGVWPYLRRLAIYFDIEDVDLSPVIASMQQATRIEISSRSFGPLSFAALQRHANTLQYLSIPRAMDSRMIRDVLCTFTRLECLEAPRIDAKDIVEGGLWACASLRKMTLPISFSSGEDSLQPAVFERMSRLLLLEELDHRLDHISGTPPKHGLIFQLQSGMAALANLSQLRRVRLDSTIQAMDVDDARWIIDHWKRLNTIGGRLSQDISIQDQLEAIFFANKIKIHLS